MQMYINSKYNVIKQNYHLLNDLYRQHTPLNTVM